MCLFQESSHGLLEIQLKKSLGFYFNQQKSNSAWRNRKKIKNSTCFSFIKWATLLTVSKSHILSVMQSFYATLCPTIVTLLMLL